MEGEDKQEIQEFTPADVGWAAGMNGMTPWEAVSLGRSEIVKERWDGSPTFGFLCDWVPFWQRHLSQAPRQQQIGVLWEPEVFIILETCLQGKNIKLAM